MSYLQNVCELLTCAKETTALSEAELRVCKAHEMRKDTPLTCAASIVTQRHTVSQPDESVKLKRELEAAYALAAAITRDTDKLSHALHTLKEKNINIDCPSLRQSIDVCKAIMAEIGKLS